MFNPLTDMIIFFTFFLLWIYTSFKVREEFKTTNEDDWISANEPKQWWLFIAIFGFWPIGLISYFLMVRRKVMMIRDFRLEHSESNPETSELMIVEIANEEVLKEVSLKDGHVESDSNFPVTEVFDYENSEPKYQL